jgi:hypothetical protein
MVTVLPTAKVVDVQLNCPATPVITTDAKVAVGVPYEVIVVSEETLVPVMV